MVSVRGVVVASVLGLVISAALGCQRSGAPSGAGGTMTIRIEGSDTMVNLAQAWAERYKQVRPEVSVQISGGGSGVGIAGLIEGVTDIATSSRKMREKEQKRAEQNTGKKPVEFVVGQDALAVYVHKENPLDTISIEELAGIYGQDGTITKWAQLGVQNKLCDDDSIIRISRQNSSGTYQYFREAVLGEQGQYKLGSIDQSGSKDLVALISRTPCAIGYSGMGYHTPEVKWLKIAKKKGDAGVEPSIASVKAGAYPIARPLLMYTLGEPTAAVKEFLDWVRAAAGQKIVAELGYIPLDEAAPAPAAASSSPGAAETPPAPRPADNGGADAASSSSTPAAPAGETAPAEPRPPRPFQPVQAKGNPHR